MGRTADVGIKIGGEDAGASEALDKTAEHVHSLGEKTKEATTEFQHSFHRSGQVIQLFGDELGKTGGHIGHLGNVVGGLAGMLAQGGVFGVAMVAASAATTALVAVFESVEMKEKA